MKLPYSDLRIGVFGDEKSPSVVLARKVVELCQKVEPRFSLQVYNGANAASEIDRMCGFFIASGEEPVAREFAKRTMAVGTIPIIIGRSCDTREFHEKTVASDVISAAELICQTHRSPADYSLCCKEMQKTRSNVSKPISRRLKIAGVFDKFSEDCFGAEVDLRLVNPNDWEDVIRDFKPDFLMVESAWNGNGGKWQYLIGTYGGSKRDKLREMVAGFRTAGIPTCFWNKEDPPHFDKFIEAAAMFDYVFTTDENCIPKYKEKIGHDRVYALPFAASPTLHNPFMKVPRDRDVCFAGTYYADRFEDRRKQMDILLDCGRDFKFDIFDRMYGNKNPGYQNYLFPERFRPFIRGKLDYADMITAYHQYKVFLNTNSVVDSGTMFSRRVFELLACGTPVVTTPSIGIRRFFGDIVGEITDVEKGKALVRRLLTDKAYYERIRRAGIQEVFSKHTYAHRLEFVAQKIGLEWHAGPCRIVWDEAKNDFNWNQKLKFLFCGHDFKFLTPVINYVSSREDVETKIQNCRGHGLTQEETAEAEKLNAWADIVFCEWALGNAVWFSRHKRPGQLLIVRMHHQEYYGGKLPYLDQIDWDAVDALVVICPDAVKQTLKRFPFLKDKIHLIYNPLDIVTRFSFSRAADSVLALGFVGMVPFRKRPDLALDILTGTLSTDRQFALHIKGKCPQDYPWMLNRKDEMALYEQRFYGRLKSFPAGIVVFDGFDPELGKWYARCGFVLSTSDFEGSHQAIAEGMAQGCLPIIRNWEGADLLYPKEYLWSDVNAAVRMIARYVENPNDYYSASEACRTYAEENFEARKICLDYDQIFSKHNLWRGIERTLPVPGLKIGILAWIPPGCHNGYRVRVEQFIAQYVRLGHEVTLFCLYKGGSSPVAIEQHRMEIERLGCRVEVLEAPWFFAMEIGKPANQMIARSLAPAVETSGIDWLQCEAAYCGRVGLQIKRHLPMLKVSFDCHGVLPEEAEMGGASDSRVKFCSEMELDCLENSDYTIFVSHAMRAHYIRKYGVLKIAGIVPCCIREQSLRESILDEDVLPELPQGRPVLGYLGTMATWQCKDEMFKLFGKLHRLYPEIFFCVLTPASDQPTARTLQTANGISSPDCLIKELPFEKVPSALVRFNAGVMLRKKSPVNSAASPTKFGEMIAAGVSVVTTDEIGDYSADLKQENFGIVVPFDELDSMDFSDETCKRIHDLLLQRQNNDVSFIKKTSTYCRSNLFWGAHVKNLVGQYWMISNVKVKNVK